MRRTLLPLLIVVSFIVALLGASLPVGTAASQPDLLFIQVAPPTAVVNVGNTQQFTATGWYTDNSTRDITTSVMWTSANATVAAIGFNTGLAQGVAPGTAMITATLSGISGSAMLSVTPAAGPAGACHL